MKDLFGREVSNLRISVTQRCNLDCLYCHREGQPSIGAGVDTVVVSRHVSAEVGVDPVEMSAEDIEKITSIGSKLGIKKVKITGGEPLLRKDIVEIISRLSKIVEEVSLVTNGMLLERFAGELKSAGLSRVNISLDSFDPDNYKKIVGGESLPKTVRGVKAAHDAGLTPVKLNMVVMRGINSSEIWKMLDFARKNNAILQLIELETTRRGVDEELYRKHHYNLEGVEDKLKKMAKKVVERDVNRRKKYILRNGDGMAEVEVVKPMHNTEFCGACTRIRLTSDGKLKPCLLRNDNLVDILTPLRGGASEGELKNIFRKAVVLREPYWH
jgi:cyclic pyranopterin phosphate synthase